MNDRDYPNAAAVAASGCSSRQLQQWRQRALLDQVGTINTTGRAVYSRRDIILLRCARELVRLGISPGFAIPAMMHMLAEVEGYLEPGTPRVIAMVRGKFDAEGDQTGLEYVVFQQAEFGEFLSKTARAPSGEAAIFVPLTDLAAKVDSMLPSGDVK